MRKLIVLFILSVCTLTFAKATVDGDKVTISGYIKDAANGEGLIGATIYLKEIQAGNITNMYGYYAINIPKGKYTVVYSFIGYQSIEKVVDLQESKTLNIELSMDSEEIEEVVVSAEAPNENVRRTEMSVQKMQMKTIKQIPALMGEVDVIKAIQMLPGVQSTSEGGSGFSVRGGSADQNLILLDEATVYNASHLMGFFSVFNNDAVKEVKLYKGDIPAAFGGRLSSLLDVRMRDGNSKKFAASGGIGTISSRLTLEGPIIKDRTSFIVSGRRTYADLFMPLAKNEDMRKSKLYFYDLNMKINHQINENNKIFLSGYFGRDHFKNPMFMMGFGNQTLTLRWNHLISKKLFTNTTLIYSLYKYYLGTPEGDANSFRWDSDLHDYAAKVDFNYYLSPKSTVKFGVSTIRHKFEPGNARGIGEEAFFNQIKLDEHKVLEHGAYISNEHKIGTSLTLKYGLRFSFYQNYGSTLEYIFDDNYEVKDSIQHKSGEFYNDYFNFEPRLGINYMINEETSIKASYSRTAQYIHLAQNSTAGSPLDIWFPSSPVVKPQIADQFAVGLFKNFRNHTIETSVELYYKKMDNAIDFKDHAQLFLNKHLEGELRFGEATAYGAEFLMKLNFDKLSGWLSYTYSKTEREIKGINNGDPYPAPYDKPHDVGIVLSYDLNKRWTLSANFLYSTGVPVTIPAARFEVEGKIAPVYTERNAFRMEDYHRLDLSATLKAKENPHRKWDWDLNISIYNVYSRHNPWALSFEQDEDDPYKTKAIKTYMFPIIPSVTYNFRF